MAAKRKNHGFTALRIEGGILPPEYLQTIAGLQAPNQKGTDYGLTKSLAIKEEIARYWRIANDLYNLYAERRERSDLDSRKVGIEDWLIPFLCDVLDFGDLEKVGEVMLGERAFRISHQACDGAVPILLLTHHFNLDKADVQLGFEGRQQAPHGLMQEYLNAEDAALWGMISNGSKLRLLRDNASLTRPSSIEADLDLIFREELYPDFAALWLTVHASRFQPLEDKPARCIIETWRNKAHETGERIRENLREGVTEALRQLGNGFLQHPANDQLRTSLENGSLASEQFFEQLLCLVYRMLFLFTVEERNLLHLPDASDEQRRIFQQGYAITRLRDRALRRRHYDRNDDLWLGFQITVRALAQGAAPLGLPALGGLFRKQQCPDLDDARIANEQLLEAVRSLAFFRSGTSLVRVNYRDMDTEELGSVYESLLELQPRIDPGAYPWRFSFLSDDAEEKSRGSARKLTGSYYTPPSLVNELIKSTLDPVIADAVASHPGNPRDAILKLNVVDPACGSGHFLLAAARRLADEIVRIETGADISDKASRQHALREVVQHCVYGVDRNPFAVELCKTALWMETVEPGKPLTFLDSHIVLGDSLVGVLNPEIMTEGIPDKAFDPLTGDNKEVSKHLKKRNRQPHTHDLFDQDAVLGVAVASIDLDAMPEETLDDVERKRAAYESAEQDEARTREKLRADIFVGSFFATKTSESMEIVPHTRDLDSLSSGQPLRSGVEPFASKLAAEHRFHHWHLRFGEIMQDGGFDAVLGNPPWERIKLQEKEFFASRSPAIAEAPNKAARDRLIQALNRAEADEAEKVLYRRFQQAKREAEAASQFARTSGRFPLAGVGDVNTYAVFAETFLRLVKPAGRAGLIVPSGIATDDTTKAFFQHLVGKQRLASLYDFENREKVFPGIDSRIKFCLLTLAGDNSPVPEAEFAFFLHQPEHLKEAERRFTLTTEDFLLFNPNTRTCPIFRTRRDMEIDRKMYQRAGVLWKEKNESQEEENPWGIKFSRMFDMSNDSGLFHIREELEENGYELEGNIFVRGDEEERYLPLYEAKLFHQYDHRFATFDGVSEKDLNGGNARQMTEAEKSDPTSVAIPRYWIPEEEVTKKLDKSNKLDSIEDRGSRIEDRGSHSGSSREQQTTEQSSAQFFHTQDWATKQQSFRYKVASSVEAYYHINQPEDTNRYRDSTGRARAQGSNDSSSSWLLPIRKTSQSTNERTSILSVIPRCGMSDRAPLISLSHAELAALIMANFNSIILDYAARTAVGGTDLSYFYIKQFPMFPPEAFLERSESGATYAEMVIPRVLQLIYISDEMSDFAHDLGYYKSPFPYDENVRHALRCELDGIFAHMYQLSRAELEWILDAPPPSQSFSTLKRREIKEFGEYKTQRLALAAFDMLENGVNPKLPQYSV